MYRLRTHRAVAHFILLTKDVDFKRNSALVEVLPLAMAVDAQGELVLHQCTAHEAVGRKSRVLK
jgi:hypothetical protein